MWDLILQCVKERTEISELSFRTWLEPLRVVSVEDDKRQVLVSGMEEELGIEYIEKRYVKLIEEVIAEYTGIEYKLIFERHQDSVSAFVKKTGLNPDRTFESFAAGSNLPAVKTAKQTAEHPGQQNPLFLYGQRGVGKTHLATAIGNEIARIHPELSVLFASADQFASELIGAMAEEQQGEKNTRELALKKYLSVDVLIVDDVHKLMDKQTIWQEFLHVFHSLLDARKQLILTADRSLNALTNKIPGYRFFAADVPIREYMLRYSGGL